MDDNSPVMQQQLLKNMQSSDSVKIIKDLESRIWICVIEGYKWGLKNNYYHFVQMDTDFSHRCQFN